MNRDKLIKDNMNLVYHILHRYYPRHIGNEDLISEGWVALCKAAKTFDESKGKFSTYAFPAILNTFKTYFRKHIKDVEIASLDFEIKDSDGHSATMYEIIPDEDSSKLFDYVERDSFVDGLSEREKEVIRLLNDGCTQIEIGEILNLNQATISRIITKVKMKWRNC